jgi:hypothetical protein
MNKTCFIKCIFLLLIGCCACNNASKNNRSNILPLDSVAVIVADSYFLESEIYVTQWKHDVKDYSWAMYEHFFEKHGLTKETFLENVRYYFTNKKYSEKIMNKVDEIVEQRVAALRDSLNVKE